MKLNILIVAFLVIPLFSIFGQENEHNDENLVDHMTWFDTFFGNEELHQVCYPKDHRSMFIFIIVFSILTVLLGSLVLFIKTKSAKKLKQKNTIIEEQNASLIASINYASRIQKAILPDSSIESQFTKNAFIFYQPKDIISGDLYWLHKQNNIQIIAVIDCTGHGVPGALLTMLASNSINKSVIEHNLIDPAEILRFMNKDIMQSLKQNLDNPIQDSMEIALVCLNTDSNELKFAGANLGLTFIQNNRIEIIKGAKCSVGSVQINNTERPITHTIHLQKGDSFYLYSDGFADQFGGPNGKKYKYKQLEELLLKNSNLDSKLQKTSIQTDFDLWKGILEQVDDVCLLGVKIE